MKKRTTILIILGVVVIIGAGLALLNNAAPSAPAQLAQPTVLASKPAPDFTLTLLSGEAVALSDFKGKTPVVVNFWAPWCPPCRKEAPALARISAVYGDRVKFIGIVENDTPDNVKAFIEDNGMKYANGIDDGSISLKYRITGIPETFWIDTEGNVIDHWIGEIDEANLTSRVRKLLQ